MSWRMVKRGSWIYEIGDHGAILVMAPNDVATTVIVYSWDEGETWTTMKIADEPIEVSNIIIEPNSISQQFVVYGTYRATDEEGNVDAEKQQKGVVIHLDFAALHEPQCKKPDSPEDSDSDYEIWHPLMVDSQIANVSLDSKFLM